MCILPGFHQGRQLVVGSLVGRVTQVIHDPEQKLLIMVMEFMPGGTILSSSRAPGLTTEPLGEPAARTYFRWVVPQAAVPAKGVLD